MLTRKIKFPQQYTSGIEDTFVLILAKNHSSASYVIQSPGNMVQAVSFLVNCREMDGFSLVLYDGFARESVKKTGNIRMT